jgi:hypothetical protein
LDGLVAVAAKRPAPLAAHQIKLKFTMKTICFASLLVAGSILFSAATTFAAIPKAGDTARCSLARPY